MCEVFDAQICETKLKTCNGTLYSSDCRPSRRYVRHTTRFRSASGRLNAFIGQEISTNSITTAMNTIVNHLWSLEKKTIKWHIKSNHGWLQDGFMQFVICNVCPRYASVLWLPFVYELHRLMRYSLAVRTHLRWVCGRGVFAIIIFRNIATFDRPV